MILRRAAIFVLIIIVCAAGLPVWLHAAAATVPPDEADSLNRPDLQSSFPEVWDDYASNPVFDPTSRAYYPTISYDPDMFGGHGPAAYYKMWYSNGSGIAHATSDDGITWSLVNGGAAVGGLFPDAHHAQVVYDPDGFGGSSVYYKIWYWDTRYLYAPGLSIAYAESADGITWTNNQGVFGGDNTYPWQRGSYGPINVHYYPNAPNTGTNPFGYQYVMYYDGTTGAFEETGLAYSPNGITWTRVSLASPVLPAGCECDVTMGGNWGQPTPWDSSYSAYGAILRGPDGVYHMWYSGGTTSVDQGIGYAYSANGITWTRSTNNPLDSLGSNAGRGDPGTWNEARNYTPVVLYDPDCFGGHGDRVPYKMWRSGRSGAGDYTIGYATAGSEADCTTAQPAALPAEPPTAEQPYIPPPVLAVFDPALSKIGELAPGALGLPGESITWTMSVTNPGGMAGHNIMIADTLPPELRIDRASTTKGTFVIDGQTVTFSLGTLEPGEVVTMRIVTTVLSTPQAGLFTNVATLSGDGVSRTATALVSGVTGLPQTGYPAD